jgi:fucose 4-O-acetylase-like acetyltransferase
VSRDDSIDALRGLAIVLVVVGHAILFTSWVRHPGAGLVQEGVTFWIPVKTATNWFFSLIYSFHMPLFAFVSGLVMWPPRDHPLIAQILRRARRLLVPYMAWCLILVLVARSALDLPSESPGRVLVDLVVGRGGLWFLYALFICAAIVICLARSPRPRWLLTVSALVAVVWSTGVVAVPNVLYLGDVLSIYPFVVLGYMLGSLKSQFSEHRRLAVALGVIVFLPLFCLENPTTLSRVSPIGQVLATIQHLSVTMHHAGLRGGFALLLSSMLLSRLATYLCACGAVLALYGLYTRRGGKVIELQAWLGKKSLGIYAIQFPALIWLIAVGVRNVFVLSLLALAVAAGLTAVLERIPLLDIVLLGKRSEIEHVNSSE